MQQVPILDGLLSISLRGCTSHHDGVVWLRVLNKALDLKVIEQLHSFLRLFRLRTDPDHVAE